MTLLVAVMLLLGLFGLRVGYIGVFVLSARALYVFFLRGVLS
jgi:hypothetical protein